MPIGGSVYSKIPSGGPHSGRRPMDPGDSGSTSRERATANQYGGGPPVRNRVYNMDIRQPTHGVENVHGVTPSFERTEREWLRNEPLNVDYNQLEKDTLANRQRVGWVPQWNTNVEGDRTNKDYIPASVANLQGYFNEPEKIRDIDTWNWVDNPNYGKNYFETNPEFKTFFPNDPYYAGLAALEEWKKTGQGIYNESDAMGSGYYGSYNNRTDQISMNLGEDLDENLKESYSNYPDTSRGYRDTLLHEMMHHWQRRDGGTDRTLYKGDMHDPITEGESVWNPKKESWWGGTLNAEQVQDFLKMHQQGKKEYQNFNEGGIAGLPGEWSPATIEGGEETFDLRSLGLDPGILSIEDLEDLFEQVGLDKSIIHKLINTGGLSQLVS